MTITTGKEALIRILHQEGVEYVFGIPGATEVVLMDALEDHPEIKYILGLQETVAAGMAEGYSRASGKPAVLNFHTSTGLAAASPLLINAFQGGVPLIITAGQQDTRLAAREPALRADLIRLAGPFTKWAAEVPTVEDIPLIMRRAFKVALQPPQGPVFVALPQNLLGEKLDFTYSSGELPFNRLHPDPEAVRAAADLLIEARHPALVVEDGVAKNDALAEVVKLAEMTGSRVYQRWMSDVNFPVDSPLYMGDLDVDSSRCRVMLGDADVLVVVGSLFFSQAVYSSGSLLPPGVKIVQIDDNPWQIGKNYPVDAGIQGNIKVTVASLSKALESRLNPRLKKEINSRSKAVAAENQLEWEKWAAGVSLEKDRLPIAPSRLMQEIRAAVKPGTRIVDDCWSNSGVLRQTFGFNESGSYFRGRGGGSIGWGLPGALGVKMASPDRPVVCVSGDGSAAWSVQALWTASHYQIPVAFVICANGIYRQVRIMKNMVMGESTRGRNLGTDISKPHLDFVGLAQSFGVKASKVERPEDLHNALSSAFNTPGPSLVEVIVEGDL
jgi:benzoylformate decarboxylase